MPRISLGPLSLNSGDCETAAGQVQRHPSVPVTTTVWSPTSPILLIRRGRVGQSHGPHHGSEISAVTVDAVRVTILGSRGDCGQEGPGFRDGRCDRCLVLTKVTARLENEGSVHDARMKPLFDALAAVSPSSVHTWVAKNTSVTWLAELVRAGRGITHEEIDKLPQNAQTLHIRAAFVAAGVLPHRNEALAQLQLWVDRIVPTISAQHQPIIRAYAEWHIVRRARLRAARGSFRPGADSANRQRIRCAINFLGWLADTGSPVADLRQHHVDTYFDGGVSNAKALGTFLAWMLARRLISGIEVPREKDGLPYRFQDQDDHAAQLRRCLTDSELPMEVRIVGALVRLYAIPVARIVELTTDRFSRDETHSYLMIEQNAVILPPSLAALIEELIAARQPDGLKRLGIRAGAGRAYRPSCSPADHRAGRATRHLWVRS